MPTSSRSLESPTGDNGLGWEEELGCVEIVPMDMSGEVKQQEVCHFIFDMPESDILFQSTTHPT